MKADTFVELLLHPYEHKLAVRPTKGDNRNAVAWSKTTYGKPKARNIPCAAFIDTLFALFGWDMANKYRLTGSMFRNGDEAVCVFSADIPGVFIHKQRVSTQADEEGTKPLVQTRNRIGVLPAKLAQDFGSNYYNELAMSEVYSQTKEQWQLRLEGQLVQVGKRLNITPYEELYRFVQEEIGDISIEEVDEDDDEG